MWSSLARIGWEVLDVLFPPRCAGCGARGEKYCPACFQQTRTINPPTCKYCGDPLEKDQGEVCKRCQRFPNPFLQIRSWAYFEEPLKSAIHNLKYKQDIGLGNVLALPLAEMVRVLPWRMDLIAPVPLDRFRKRERGYNQAALLARPLSRLVGAPYAAGIIRRVRATRTQVGLTRGERSENVAGAFEAVSAKTAGQVVLLVDDVITTGSTLSACAQALRSAGAERVYGVTLARATRL